MLWHVINLDRRKDRWQRAKTHFQECRFDIVRVSAVDAKTMPSSLRKVPCHEDEHERRANFSAIACALSHAGLLEQLSEGTSETILVAEDDARFDNPEEVKRLVQNFSNQSSCGLLNLGFGEMWKPSFHEEVASGIFRCEGKSIFAHAYAVKRSFARAIATNMRQGAVHLCLGGDRRAFAADVVWVQTPGLVHCVPAHPVAHQVDAMGSDIESTGP